jgi:hypothetical protein
MKYVIFTFSGEGLPIAEKLYKEGQDVIVAQIESDKDIYTAEEIKNYKPEERDNKKARLSLYDGVLKKYPADKVTQALKKIRNKQDYFLFFDFNHCFKYAEELSGLGFNGNFPTEEDRKYEVDRDYAKDIVAANYPEVRVAKKKEFKTIADFLKVADDMFKDEIWVLKPFGDGAKTKVPDSSIPENAKQEIIAALESDPNGYESEGFELELLIPDAIEVTPQKVWYNGKPIYCSIDIETKRLGSDRGPMTGCAADLVFPVDMNSRICRIAFPKYCDELAKKHEGMFIWDISLLINPRNGEIYMGEFCPNRTGYNCFYTELSLLPYVSNYFEDIVAGKNPMNGAEKFGASVRMFFVREKGIKPDVAISIEDDWRAENLWLIDAKVKDGTAYTAGYIWDIGVATGSGQTIDEAASNCYLNADGLLYEHKMLGRSKIDYLSGHGKDSIQKRYNYLIENKLI